MDAVLVVITDVVVMVMVEVVEAMEVITDVVVMVMVVMVMVEVVEAMEVITDVMVMVMVEVVEAVEVVVVSGGAYRPPGAALGAPRSAPVRARPYSCSPRCRL